jgi:hypothetical protein
MYPDENGGEEISAAMLNSVKDAEDKLRTKERKGDLDDLPTGHPLRIAMEEAKQKYELKQQLEKEQQEKMKTGKKIQPKKKESKEQKELNQKREANAKELVDSAKSINDMLDKSIYSMQELIKLSMSTQSLCKDLNPYLQLKLKRMERMLMAFTRGLNESKIRPFIRSLSEQRNDNIENRS